MSRSCGGSTQRFLSTILHARLGALVPYSRRPRPRVSARRPARLAMQSLCTTRGWPRPCARKRDHKPSVQLSVSAVALGAVNSFTGA